MFAVLMLAKYIALLGMHEVLIAVRSYLVHFVHESSRCEPNKRGVSPEVGASAALIFFWKPLSSKSAYAPAVIQDR